MNAVGAVIEDTAESELGRALRRALRPTSGTSRSAVPFRRRLDLGQAIEDASAPNWDGYGASPVDEGALFAARAFLEALPSSWPDPDISVDPDGEIAFEWSRGPLRVFAVSVGTAGIASYAGLFGDSRTHGRETRPERILSVVASSLARIYPQARGLSAVS